LTFFRYLVFKQNTRVTIIIKDFVSAKILKEKTIRGRTHVFTFADYIELFEKK